MLLLFFFDIFSSLESEYLILPIDFWAISHPTTSCFISNSVIENLLSKLFLFSIKLKCFSIIVAPSETAAMLEYMSSTLSTGERIEIRGFGSFSLHYRPPRVGRNPKTGDPVSLPAKHVPHFKPGKQMRERVNSCNSPIID